MNIAPADFDLLVRLATDAGANPRDWALVIYEESRWNPALPNHSGAPYYGLNQMGAEEARSVGFTGAMPEDWLALPVSEQLPYVARFFVQKRAAVPVAFASAAHLLGANFLPGRMQGHDDPFDVDYALTRAPESFYTANALYDPNHTGAITIRDLGAFLDRLARNNPHDMAALEAGIADAEARAGISSPIAHVLRGAAWTVGVAAVVWTGWQLWQNFKA